MRKLLATKFPLWTLACLVFCLISQQPQAVARAGGGRSMGRSFSRPSQPRPASHPAYTPPQDRGSRSAPQPAHVPPVQNSVPPPVAPRSGFMQGVMGGVAGGMLGSMLFHSFSSGSGGLMGGGGGGSSGVGLLDLLLLAGLGYLGYRWWKSQRHKEVASYATNTGPELGNTEAMTYGSGPTFDTDQLVPNSMKVNSSLEAEAATDIFFQLQAAWTRRDISSLDKILEDDMKEMLENEVAQLKVKHQINRLENIAVRKVEIRDAWSELGAELATVRILANMLDYNVDELSGQIIEGSISMPVKFEEDWTFKRQPGDANWKLAGIEQV